MTTHLQIQFVIADSSRARWVNRSKTADDFITAKELHAEPLITGDPQGVVFEASSGQRFNVQEGDEAAKKHHAVFARQVADALNAQAAAGAFERLALVAPTRTLSAITEHLNGAAKAKLVNTLAKDLTKTPDHELGHWLRPLELG